MATLISGDNGPIQTYTLAIGQLHATSPLPVLEATPNFYSAGYVGGGGDRHNLYGSDFSYDAAGLTGGTVTAWEVFPASWDGADPNIRSFLLKDLSVPATTFADWLAHGSDTPVQLTLLAGDDSIVGGSYADEIMGCAGDDTIMGGDGDDAITGGSGWEADAAGTPVDPLHDGSNYLRGEAGNDHIDGGEGFDDINGNQGDDDLHGGGGDDWVVGGQGDDTLFGDRGGSSAWLHSGLVVDQSGYDTAADGADIVLGNLGNDTCDGEAGNDTVRGGQGDDAVWGSAGDDWLSGDRGNDTITGGAGADIFHTFEMAGIDRVTDFNLGEGDRVMLDAGSTYSVAQVGADTVITLGGGAQMILVGVQLSTLGAGWIFTG